jgi:hypothetical protein
MCRGSRAAFSMKEEMRVTAGASERELTQAGPVPPVAITRFAIYDTTYGDKFGRGIGTIGHLLSAHAGQALVPAPCFRD